MKYAEPVREAAAAIQVISGDDIRRAGITTLPEALRLATGVQVARFDGRTWAISARGFNISTANKLVVMIDGRSVYTPLFSGVFWDVQDVVLADVDRIEVIRGPGGTLWGANAVNGVINVVTRPAAETEGTLVQVDGRTELGQAAVRHGIRMGSWRRRSRVRPSSAIATARGSRPAPSARGSTAMRPGGVPPGNRPVGQDALHPAGRRLQGKASGLSGLAGQRRRGRKSSRARQPYQKLGIAGAVPGLLRRHVPQGPAPVLRAPRYARPRGAVSNGLEDTARHRLGPRLSGDARARRAEPGPVLRARDTDIAAHQPVRAGRHRARAGTCPPHHRHESRAQRLHWYGVPA